MKLTFGNKCIKSALKINEDKWGCFDEHYFTCLDENDDGKLSFEGKFYTLKKHVSITRTILLIEKYT